MFCFYKAPKNKGLTGGTYSSPVACTATRRRRPVHDVFSVTYSQGRFHPLWTLLIDQKGLEHETRCGDLIG
jgi:hypothetical protein